MAERRIVWEPGTLFDNIDAAVRRVGMDQPGLVWGLANMDFPSPKERDAFYDAISREEG